MGFSQTFKALADPARREILFMLRQQRMAAGAIAAKFDMTGATVSYHPSVLKKAELVFETREKNFIYYELNTSVFEELLLWLAQFSPQEAAQEAPQIDVEQEKGEEES